MVAKKLEELVFATQQERYMLSAENERIQKENIKLNNEHLKLLS